VLTREQSVESWVQARGGIDPNAPRLSFDRYLRGLATGNWDGASEERALSEGTLTAGGHLVPTPLSSRVIDLARNASRVIQAGATTVPMTSGTLKLARLTGENSPAWKSENASITAQDMTFDSVTLTARTLVRLVTLSVELFEDADPSSEDVIANSFAQQLALELDRVGLRGTGTPPEPKGILNHTNVTLTAHGTNGSVIGSPPAAGTMGWEFLVDSIGTVRNFNFEPNAQVMAPRTTQSLAKLRDTTNQYIAPPSYLDGIPRLVTKQVPINLTVGSSTDTSEVYTGQWDQCLIGIRTNFSLQFLRERFLADNLQYAFLAYLRADVQLAQPTAFVVDTGVRG
jgi:HK97 family phage major capsid protein